MNNTQVYSARSTSLADVTSGEKISVKEAEQRVGVQIETCPRLL